MMTYDAECHVLTCCLYVFFHKLSSVLTICLLFSCVICFLMLEVPILDKVFYQM